MVEVTPWCNSNLIGEGEEHQKECSEEVRGAYLLRNNARIIADMPVLRKNWQIELFVSCEFCLTGEFPAHHHAGANSNKGIISLRNKVNLI